jgi:hypothetical protein
MSEKKAIKNLLIPQLPVKEKKNTFIYAPSGSNITQVEIMHYLLQVINEYPEIATRPVKLLKSFALTYIRERSFSLYAAQNAKYKNWLDAESDICLRITTIGPYMVSV